MTPRDARRPTPDELLPHDAPARLLERIVEVGEESIICRGRVPGDSPFVHEGNVPSFVAMEMAAQSAAAWETLGRMKESTAPEPRVGYVVSAREIELFRDEFPAEVDLVVRVELAGAAPPLTMYRFEVSHEQRRVATGTISTYITAEQG